jgi:DNA polymerase III epsilon subunit-like protein
MPKKNYLILYDYESCTEPATNPHLTQPSQLAAVVIDPIRLEIVKNGTFNSGMKPIGDYTFDKKALEITRKTEEEILSYPDPKVVWADFVSFVHQFKISKSIWGNPIPCGHNICNFDNAITRRLVETYGPKTPNGEADLFHPIHKFDTMDILYLWMESRPDFEKYNADFTRDYFGFGETSKANAHDALQDCLDMAWVLLKFLRLHRSLTNKIPFRGAYARTN